MIKYIDNFLSPNVIASMDKYCQIFEDDYNSDTYWNPKFTKETDRVSCFSNKVEGTELFELKEDIFHNPNNPFYKDKRIRNMSCAIQKYPKGAVLSAHKDRCIGSVTIFLNKEWGINDGGIFHWLEDDMDGQGYSVIPKYNSAVYMISNDPNKRLNVVGPLHWVTEVLSDTPRCCIQLFMWGDGNPNNTLAEGDSWYGYDGVLGDKSGY